MKSKIRTVCLFCMRSHPNGKPKKCAFKAAIASALVRVIPAHEAILIMDKTPFLTDAWKRFQKSERTSEK